MVTQIDRTKLLRLLEEDEAQVVDFLPEREYSDSHIPGAISRPLRRLTKDTANALRRDKPVVVY